jgi:protease-4
MSFRTASAILRGKWLIDPSWAAAHMPIVMRMLKGETVDFGFEKDETVEAKVLSNKAGVIYEVSYYTDLSRLPSGSIAMVSLCGPVTKYGDSCSYGSVDHVRTINRLAVSENVKGIILNVDSPGGEASGTAALAECIRNATKLKPVIGLVDDGIAASAAMWIISACSEIYTTKKTDMVGSVGAYQTLADWYGYAESEGLKIRDIYAPQSTMKNFEYKEALKGNDDPLKEELSILVDDFISTVRNNRNGKIKKEDWTTGSMFYTKDAIRQGLIDGQKSLEQVVKRMDQLIASTPSNSQIINTNTMAFEKTLAAAKAEKFEVVEGGFLLTEEHLDNNEANIIALENKITEANTAAEATKTAHDGEVGQLNEQITAANAGKQTAEDALAIANEIITAQNTEIENLKAEVAQLKKSPATTPAATVTTEDPAPVNANAKKEGHLNPNSSLNKAAEGVYTQKTEKTKLR